MSSHPDSGPTDPQPEAPRGALPHMDASGRARMVDTGNREPTRREATAQARVRMSGALLERIRSGTVPKGDLPAVARLAGILAAKRTDELIPLCHTLPMDSVEVELELEDGGILITTRAATTARTGVEMEALVAASVAALAIIDMGKAVDPHMQVDELRVTGKRGGRSGDWGTLAPEEGS